MFSCEFCEISRNTYFHRTPVLAAFIHHVTALLFLSKQFKKAIKTAHTLKTMKVRVTTTLLFSIILVANLIDSFLNTEFSLIVQGQVIKEITQPDPSISLKDCIKQCMHILSCVSLNYNTQTYECQLSDKEVKTGAIVPKTNDWNYIQLGKTPCLNSGTYIYKSKGLQFQYVQNISRKVRC